MRACRLVPGTPMGTCPLQHLEMTSLWWPPSTCLNQTALAASPFQNVEVPPPLQRKNTHCGSVRATLFEKLFHDMQVSHSAATSHVHSEASAAMCPGPAEHVHVTPLCRQRACQRAPRTPVVTNHCSTGRFPLQQHEHKELTTGGSRGPLPTLSGTHWIV